MITLGIGSQIRLAVAVGVTRRHHDAEEIARAGPAGTPAVS
jgi:hypothetical protein